MKLVLEGRMEGKRRRGRPRMGMIDDVLDETYGDMKRKAENRESWRIWKPRTCPMTVGRELMMMMIAPSGPYKSGVDCFSRPVLCQYVARSISCRFSPVYNPNIGIVNL